MLLAQFAASAAAVRWLRDHGAVTEAQQRQINPLYQPPAGWPDVAAGAPAWDSALAALLQDADAPLPP